MRHTLQRGAGRGPGKPMKAKALMRNSRGVRSLFVAASFAAMACGGRTEGDPASDYTSGGSDSNAPSGSAGSSSQPGGKGTNFGSTTLPPCVLGVEQWRADKCDYYAEGRCYAEKLEACACVCPRNVANTTCISNFDVPSRVTCF